MKAKAERHFNGLRQIVPDVKRIMLFGYDSDETAFNVGDDNPLITEWKRKNIENYLLVPDAWKRAILKESELNEPDLFSHSVLQIVDESFEEQNLLLPKRNTWKTISANIFKVVDGKKILFQNQDSLFQKIRGKSGFLLTRETIALSMLPEEIHEDIEKLFEKLEKTKN